MRKIASFLSCLIVTLTSLMAQEAEAPAENKNIDFVGYFCKGDTMVYRYDDLVETINEQDTIQEQYTYQEFMIVVIDSTSNSYRLEVSQLDFHFEHKNELLQESSNILAEKIRDLKCILLTDECGAIQHIENWQEIRDVTKKGIDLACDSLYAKLPQLETVMPRRQFQSTIQMQYSTEEGVMSSYPELTLLFAVLGKSVPTELVTSEGLNQHGYPTKTAMIANYSEVEDDLSFDNDYEFNSSSTTTIQAKDAIELGQNAMGMLLSEEANQKMEEENVMKEVEKVIGSEIKGEVDEQYKYFFNGWPKYAYYNQKVQTGSSIKETTRLAQWMRRVWK